MKVLDNTPAVLSLGKLCDENGYSYEWINGQKPHLTKDGIRIICNTENFVPIVVPDLSNSSSGSDSSTSRTLSRQESHYSASSSSSSSSPTVSEMQTREREDRTQSDMSPVIVSTTVDERSGRPDIDQANKNRKNTIKKQPRGNNRATLCLPTQVVQVLKSRSGCKNSEKNLVDDEIPEHGDLTPVLLMKLLLEPILKRRKDLCKHSVYTHVPKDRDCEICKRTKITRAPCRRRNGDHLHTVTSLLITDLHIRDWAIFVLPRIHSLAWDVS